MKTIFIIQLLLFSASVLVTSFAFFLLFSNHAPLLQGDDTSIDFILTPGMFLAFWIVGLLWRALLFVSFLRRASMTRLLFTADMIVAIWNIVFVFFLFREKTFSVLLYFLVVCTAFGSLMLKKICLVAYRRFEASKID